MISSNINSMKTQHNTKDQQETDCTKVDRKGHHRPENRSDQEEENLGLDADGSSAEDSLYANLNHDNDRISGNPDGEDDRNDTNEPAGSSPIMDK